MKNMKGRILRKLKTMSNPGWSPGLVFEANSSVQTSNPDNEHKNHCLPTPTGENISISEEDLDFGPNADSREKYVSSIGSKEGNVRASESRPGETVAVSMHGRVQLSADFDTESVSSSVPLGCLKLELAEHINHERPEDKERLALLSDFEDRCPPGGRESLVLYTTSLRGIRKTFEDCSTIRFLLESFRVVYSERDVSMHLEYREELWKALGGRVVPPRLFIRGRYIGGADEVVGLHEKGMLQSLLQGIPLSPSRNPCRGCAGLRFVLCSSCSGSRKVMPEGQNSGMPIRCPDCNENGLIKCPVCS